MTDVRRDKYGGNESVMEVSAVCLKEAFAELFRSWDAAVSRSQETPEYVHELRVATRRVSAALELFEDWLPSRKTERLVRKLDALRKSAGSARDCDVFAARVAEGAPDEGVKQIEEHLRAQRIEAQQTLASYYEQCESGEKLERRALDLVSSLRPRGRRAKRMPTRFCEWAPRRLRKAIRNFFAESSVDTKQLKRLHEFRIRAKQFRYCLELLGPTLNRQLFKKAFSGLRKLSQRLGEINDHATAIETLSLWIDSQFDAQSIQTLRQWRKEERRLLRRAITDFADWWSPRRQRQLHRKLKHAAKSPLAVTAAA
jgi:CHAD domain-containing protein